jgi:Icc-related predicted phosphoesterase
MNKNIRRLRCDSVLALHGHVHESRTTRSDTPESWANPRGHPCAIGCARVRIHPGLVVEVEPRLALGLMG